MRRRFIWLLLALAAILFFALRPSPSTPRFIKAAGAKGAILATHMLTLGPAEQTVRDLALADARIRDLADNQTLLFLYAQEMGFAEAASYRQQGCQALNCTHLVFYNPVAGGTVEAIWNETSQLLLHAWADPAARPAASPYLLPRIVAVAAADPDVQAVLGDIRKAETAMLPISTWLTDDACEQDWCVDLSFHDPAGSGRIFHVVVNVQQEMVARTFYTRSRVDRFYQTPPELDPNAPLYTDGCHSAHDWEVCWEMTSHDGINFYDARFKGQSIFTSAKIAQVEAFYPSWPGGYRDEIGFGASVPPKFDTRLTNFDQGFEVRQLFTEPFNWPNCICCYRYEQIAQFYADGRFDLRFVSQGPGCDDLSRYRPFWRIALALGENDDPDAAWVWQETAWTPLEQEAELPLFEDLSLEGQKLATFDDRLHYRWQPEANDPLGQNEGRLFILRANPDEGDGPILAGPADTYRPPRQWLDAESVTDGELVVWYVPTLFTKKGGPWWCMPDPEPEFSPCEAILSAVPDTEIRQPTAEELTQLQATPTPAGGDAAQFPSDGVAVRPTPRPVMGETAEAIILNAGCGACHVIGSLGEAGKVGPDLSNIGVLAGQRVPGQPAVEYLRNSILYPDLFLTADCPNGPCVANAMPGDYYLRLTDQQIDTLITFLLEQQTEAHSGTPSPIQDGDQAAEETASAADPATPTPTQRTWGWSLALGLAVFILAALFILIRIGARTQ